MLDVLRGDEVDIHLTLQENASSEYGAVRREGQSRCEPYSIAANDFMDVCARVVNNSGKPLTLVFVPSQLTLVVTRPKPHLSN